MKLHKEVGPPKPTPTAPPVPPSPEPMPQFFYDLIGCIITVILIAGGVSLYMAAKKDGFHSLDLFFNPDHNKDGRPHVPGDATSPR